MQKNKDSGVEWIGSIPENWELRQAGQLADQTKCANDGMVETNLLSLSYGKIKRRDINATEGLLPASFEGYNIIEENDIVLRFTDLQNDHKSLRVGRATERGIITSAYTIIRPFDPDDSKYVYYALHCFDLKKGFYGMGAGVRQGLKWQEAKYIVLPYPPKEARREIVAYLDKMITEIDSAILAAEVAIEECKLYKKSVIFQAVTKGLNPDVPMKESGIEWLRTVPAHWDVLPHKYLMHKEKNICEKWSGEDVVSLTMQGVIVRDLVNPKGKMPATFDGYQYVEPSNLLLCLFDVDVTPRCVGLIKNKGVTSPAYSQFVIHENTDASYMNWYLTAIDNQKLYLHLTSTLRSSFTADDFGKIPCCHPPIEEQRAIAAFLDKKTLEIDEAVESKQQIIEDLKGYKKALIFETVTGKREVPCL